MKTRRIMIAGVLVAFLALSACTPKVNTTSFTAPARASDDIATGIKLGLAAETDLEKQKLLTSQEALRVIDGLSAINVANIQFNTDLGVAKVSRNKTALKPSLDALRKTVTDLNANGVLGIKSDKAKATFTLTMQALNLALATLETFVGN
jgi:hypothetical protein